MRRAKRVLMAGAIAGTSLLAGASDAQSQAEPLSPRIAPIGFLVGSWIGEQGRAGNDQVSGRFQIETTVNGAALLRRDHDELRSIDGGPARSFEQIMLIYPENDGLSADYYDGEHVIHYRNAKIDPGRSVRFTTSPSPSMPVFSLTYTLLTANRLSVRFELEPPGRTEFKILAEGTALRQN